MFDNVKFLELLLYFFEKGVDHIKDLMINDDHFIAFSVEQLHINCHSQREICYIMENLVHDWVPSPPQE